MDAATPRKTVVPSAPPVPVVLVVGCSDEFLATCHEAGDRLGVTVRACDVGSIGAEIVAAQPYAVIVTEDLYRADPEAVDSALRQTPTSLVRIEPRSAQAAEVRKLLVEAVFESATAAPWSEVRSILG